MNNTIEFAFLNVGDAFAYNGDTFIKTGKVTAALQGQDHLPPADRRWYFGAESEVMTDTFGAAP